MKRILLSLIRKDARNTEPPKPRHVPARDRHWREKRRYVEVHRRLAAELGVKWEPRT